MRRYLFLTMIFVAGSFPLSWTQSQSSQPVDPTAQAPSTVAPTTPPTFPPGMKRPEERVSHPKSTAAEASKQGSGRDFVGTIVKRRRVYVLKAADAEYLLDDQPEANRYKGKRVKVTGRAVENHTIRVKTIELSPSK